MHIIWNSGEVGIWAGCDYCCCVQALGRLLTHADVNERLKGRRAELYWPDDNLWYLIEIHDVDTTNHKAQIMYVTGETEELDLLEIVREGHMSLISENSGGRAYM